MAEQPMQNAEQIENIISNVGTLHLRYIPLSVLREMGGQLNDSHTHKGWQLVAEKMSYSGDQIMAFKNLEYRDHGSAFLEEVFVRRYPNMEIQKFLTILQQCERFDVINTINDNIPAIKEEFRLHQAHLNSPLPPPSTKCERCCHCAHQCCNRQSPSPCFHSQIQCCNRQSPSPCCHSQRESIPLQEERSLVYERYQQHEHDDTQENNTQSSLNTHPCCHSQRESIPLQEECSLVYERSQQHEHDDTQEKNTQSYLNMHQTKHIFITFSSSNMNNLLHLVEKLKQNDLFAQSDEKDTSKRLPERTIKRFNRASVIIVLISPDYKRAKKNKRTNSTTRDVYAAEIYCAMKDEIKNNKKKKIYNNRFIPVLLHSATKPDIPSFLKEKQYYNWPTQKVDLIHFLQESVCE